MEVVKLLLSDGKYKYSKCYLSFELLELKNSLKPKAIMSIQDFTSIKRDSSSSKW